MTNSELITIYRKLEPIYIKTLNETHAQFNSIFSVNLNNKRFELIFGPWIFFFLHFSYGRYIERDKQSTNIEEVNFNFFTFDSYSEFMRAINDQRFINSFDNSINFLLNENGNIKNGFPVKFVAKNIFFKFKQVFKKIRYHLITIFFLKKIFTVSCHTGLSGGTLKKQKKDFYNIDLPFNFWPYRSKVFDLGRRRLLFDSISCDDKFTILFKKLLSLYVPFSHVEFVPFFLNLPTFHNTPHSVISGNAIYNNESFKWFFINSNSDKLFGIPHGGIDYALASFHPWRFLEKRIYDKYFPFWKEDNSMDRYPSVRAWEFSYDFRSNIGNQAVFITTKQDRYTSYFPKHPSVFNSLIENNLKFLKYLCDSNSERVIYHKPHFEDYIWNTHEIYKKAYPNNIFLENNQDFSILNNKYGIFIFDHLSTTVLQCINLNRPFIVVLPSDYIDFIEDRFSIHQILIELNIIYTDIESAVKFINGKNYVEWWESVISDLKYASLQEFLGVGLDKTDPPFFKS